MQPRIHIYDTTLRDGSQAEGVSFSLEDKIHLAHRLDDFGMDYIEGGWPGSNPKDIEFFAQMKNETLMHAKLAAFGSTRRPNVRAADDEYLRMLIEAETPVITIFGKSWDFHVTHALKVTLSANLDMIRDSVGFLCANAPEVVYDAEHYFDGFKHKRDYALATVRAAREAGASAIVLCDTNGGTMPYEIQQIVEETIAEIGGEFGIHAHDDAGCGVANSLAAVRGGVRHVQGTVNGYGERCGNANLCPIIANLLLKLDCDCLTPDALKQLTGLSQYLDEVANISPNNRQAYVGRSAFAHKAGIHVDGVLKHRATYEHIDPETVGNTRRVLVSELSGGSTIVNKAYKSHITLAKGSPETRALLRKVAELEQEGYSFEGAEASFEMLMMRFAGTYPQLFNIQSFRVIAEKRGGGEPITEATIKLSVGDQERLTVAEGDGPVHALDLALRKGLIEFFPELADIKLTDFKVRVVNTREGTAAKVRTIIESADANRRWATVGVSTNLVEAAWEALVDSVVYGLNSRRSAPAGNPSGHEAGNHA